MDDLHKPNPFIKWVGGKRQIISQHLDQLFPNEFNTYIEPFVGGGAVLFHLQPENAIVNDLNSELINAYQMLQKHPQALMSQLDHYKTQHSESFYYQIRNAKLETNLERAARFIYLNKTAFNGLYRVNQKNEFNVSFNQVSQDKLNLYNPTNLQNVTNYLNNNNIQFHNGDYQKILQLAQKGDFIFCDPPYDYEINTKGFTNYTKSGFNQDNQIALAQKLKELDGQGVKWMVTNHDTQLINHLYQDFKIKPIATNRNVNSVGFKRKATGKEVVITNY